MKKGVGILISAICLLAVVLVAIFGTRPQGIVPVVYISSLTIKPSDDSRYWTNKSGDHQCLIVYNPDIEINDGENTYMPFLFTTEVLPDNATDRSFVYTLASDYSDYMIFASGENAPRQGAFLIKKKTDRDSKHPYLLSLSVHPEDGGSGSGDTLKVVLDYSRAYVDPTAPLVE